MSLKSWFPIPPKSHFSLANIPFGIITTPTSKTPRPAVAIGDHALDLAVFAANSGFSDLRSVQPHLSVFYKPTLNDFAALGQPLHQQIRQYLQEVFRENTRFPVLSSTSVLKEKCIFPRKDVTNHCPLQIGDYTDFFAGKNHAYTAGALFRGPKDALQPNYTHLPVGYHGRASSVVVSGTPIRRPWGQILDNPKVDPKVPILAPSRRLDFELELGAFVCRANKTGEPVPIGEARNSLFGVVLMNDWSARDIQAWEFVPLGPFNSKNFGTTISAWVVLADALEPFRCKGIENDTKLLPYLKDVEENVYDINLEVDITSLFPFSLIPAATDERRSSIRRNHYHHSNQCAESPLLLPTNVNAPFDYRLPHAGRRSPRIGDHQWDGFRHGGVLAGTISEWKDRNTTER